MEQYRLRGEELPRRTLTEATGEFFRKWNGVISIAGAGLTAGLSVSNWDTLNSYEKVGYPIAIGLMLMQGIRGINRIHEENEQLKANRGRTALVFQFNFFHSEERRPHTD